MLLLPTTVILDYIYNRLVSAYIWMGVVGAIAILTTFIVEKRTSFISEIPETTEENIKQCEKKVIHRLKKDSDYYESFLETLAEEGVVNIQRGEE